MDGIANIRGFSIVFLKPGYLLFLMHQEENESKRMALFCSLDTEIVSSLCKTMEEQGQFSSEENVPFAQHELLKEDLKNAIVSASDISESFDSFPYYLRYIDYNSLLEKSGSFVLSFAIIYLEMYAIV
jgi:hypothetical protein